MSNDPTSSMASVWDTLNRMKARQAEAQAKTPRQQTSHRKNAIALFQREINAAASRGETDGHTVLTHMRQIMDADPSVRALVEQHRQSILANPNAEVQAVDKLIQQVRQQFATVSPSLKGASDLAYRINLELGS